MCGAHFSVFTNANVYVNVGYSRMKILVDFVCNLQKCSSNRWKDLGLFIPASYTPSLNLAGVNFVFHLSELMNKVQVKGGGSADFLKY